uniref:Reverse transcriptase domain-containing protein n=1 Tax=Clytia hemisphaerica TaxID=252671 RepID=A0A7M5WT73_9CNID
MAEQQQNVVDYNQLQVIIQQLVRNEMQPAMQQAENRAKQALDQTTASTSTNFSKLKAKLDKQRLNDNITFTKAGHTDQFKHNQQVLEVIDDTLEAMESADVQAMKDHLEKERFWEFDQSTESLSVAGRIQEFSNFWENELKASNFALGIVREGYKIPFESEPPPFFAKNNASSLKNREFVKDSIEKLLENGCIEKVTEPPYCINPLTVAERNSKLRLVLDLRHVNKHIQPNKFSYENIKQVSEMINKDDFLITFDLKSGYHHVPINLRFQTFLGFAWEFNSEMQFFVFKVLPFGLNIACLVFTKLMRQLVKRWRSKGIKCAMYLDDGIVGDNSYFSLIQTRDLMLNDMRSAGLTVNFEKSSLEPEKNKTWLGFIIDTENMNFEVPTPKIQKVLKLISEALNSEFLSARKISRIAGNLIAMAPAIGPIVYLFTKQIYKFVESSFSWDKKRLLSLNVLQELEFGTTI